MEYTYVLLSERDGHFYTGSTGDLRARFRDHRLKESLHMIRLNTLERH